MAAPASSIRVRAGKRSTDAEADADEHALSCSPALPTQTATTSTCTPERHDQQQEQQQQQQEQEEEEYLFSCRCDSAKAVSSLLSCLVSTDSKKTIQPVTVFCSPTALTFHVYASSGKQSQISVDLNKSLFCDYQVTAGEFSVNLTSVLECLHVLGANHHHLEKTKLSWAYSPISQTFEMELMEEGGVLSTATIPGLLPPSTTTTTSNSSSSSLALAFTQSPVLFRILLKSEWLKQGWNELEHVVGASACTVHVSSHALQLATVGQNAAECIVSLLPASAQGLFLSLEETTSCRTESNNNNNNNNNTKEAIFSYPWSAFSLGMRALDIAEETCLTINRDGMMAIQHQILLGNQDQEEHANFCDFLMASLTNTTQEENGSSTTTSMVQQQQAPPPLSLGWKSQDEHAKSDSEEEGEEEQSPPISTAPLFASVVDNASVSTHNTTTHVQRRRRRRQSHAAQQALSSMNPPQEEKESCDEEEEEEEMSATPQRQQQRRRRHGKRQVPHDASSSSPEIEYGNDSD
jgi:hypothetical protein